MTDDVVVGKQMLQQSSSYHHSAVAKVNTVHLPGTESQCEYDDDKVYYDASIAASELVKLI